MPQLGDRLPADFISAYKRQRIVRAYADLVIETGHPGSVADIVRRAGIARNTFYENFGGKGQAGKALIAKALPELADQLDPGDESGLGLLALEVAARAEVHDWSVATSHAVDALGELRSVAGSVGAVAGIDDSPKCSLPSGRHGFSKDFVSANQRHRMLSAFAQAVAEQGFHRVTIADVANRAKVSRRTFYEHFKGGINRAATALVFEASERATSAPSRESFSGLGVLVVEVAAVGLVEGRAAAIGLVDSVELAFRPITDPAHASSERAAA